MLAVASVKLARNENINHLFCECSFASKIWTLLGDKCHFPRVKRRWDETVTWCAEGFKGKSLSAKVNRLVLLVKGEQKFRPKLKF